MKKFWAFFTVMFILVITPLTNYAQHAERNARVTIAMNDLSYNKRETTKSKGSVWSSIADVLLTGQTTKQQDGYEEAVRTAIVKGLSRARRVSAIDGKLKEDELAQGSDYYINATIANISTTSKTEESKDKKTVKTFYKGLIGVTLQVINTKTDEVESSPTFNVTETDNSWVETAEGALNKSLLRLASHITKYFNKWLPIEANILESATEKKDKQKEVYIDFGTREGAEYGMHLAVYVVKVVAGREAKQYLGRLKLEEVQGDDISLCKVQNGGKEIKAAFDNGEALIITSLD